MSKAERPSDLKRQAGLRLRAVREHFGVGQDAMAALLGVTRTALANWEAGTRLADVAAMVRLYRRRGVTLEWIYCGSLREMGLELGAGCERRALELGAHADGAFIDWESSTFQTLAPTPLPRTARQPRDTLRPGMHEKAAQKLR